MGAYRSNTAAQSLPVRGAWVEITDTVSPRYGYMSLPVRGAWVEIARLMRSFRFTTVAPRAGSVG